MADHADGPPPLTIEYDEALDVLTVNGVKYSGALFRTLAFPRTDRLFRFTREGPTVTVIDCGSAFPASGERSH
jgi:hypothetical protein